MRTPVGSPQLALEVLMAEAVSALGLPERIDVDLGGLRFSATFRAPAGATLRVSQLLAGRWVELLRFDDFVEQAHYHVLAAGDATLVDAATDGVALDFYLDQIGQHLAELLARGGFEEIVPAIDVDAVSNNIDQVRQAMIDVVPDGYTRVPGVGLRRDDHRAGTP
jgi:hypothetical protein